METIIRKTYRATVKESDADDGTIEMMIPISSRQVDRDGEVIEPSAFKKTIKKFMEHPVLVASHDYRNLTHQIGEWTSLKVRDEGVEGKPKYYINEGNPEADWAYKLAQKGVAAFSIGFIPKTWDDGDGEKTPRRTYKDIELLEISQVIVPSNREAIQSMRSKSVGDPVVTEILDEAEKEIQNKEVDVVTKPEETMDMFRIPVPGEVGKHDDHKIRTIDVSKEKGVKALYCVDDKKIITYMFDKEKWDSMEAARAWMMEHMPKSLEHASQSAIIDEIDYLKSLLTNGLNDEAQQSFNALVKSVRGELTKMDLGGMQEMHDMMAACEMMAKKAKKMSEDMMAGDEDHEDMEDEPKRSPEDDISVKKKDIEELLQVIQNTKLGG